MKKSEEILSNIKTMQYAITEAELAYKAQLELEKEENWYLTDGAVTFRDTEDKEISLRIECNHHSYEYAKNNNFNSLLMITIANDVNMYEMDCVLSLQQTKGLAENLNKVISYMEAE